MNVSAISARSALGKAVRWPLRLIPPSAVVPVLQGPLRGARWIVGSSNHGCWLGTYEHDKQRAFARLLRPGDVLYDVGAHVGFYTLLGARTVGPKGRVVAFEPFPRNLAFLRRHLRLNRVANATVVAAAVGDAAGTAAFSEGPGADRPTTAVAASSMGRLDPGGPHAVPVVRLDEVVDRGDVPAPTALKIDVEGGEVGVLAGAERLLERRHPTIFLATHGQALHRECCERLDAAGYELAPIGGRSLEDSDELLAT
ncbi:MAG TPA: FkbM family methyltransferase [Actinomycetota bacterium]